MLQIWGLPIGISILVIKYFVIGININHGMSLLRNAVLFNCYQFSSIALLERMDSLSHSIANTLKRFSSIVLASFMFNEEWDVFRKCGFFISSIGFPVYVFGKSSLISKNIFRGQNVSSGFQIALFLGLIIYTGLHMLSAKAFSSTKASNDLFSKLSHYSRTRSSKQIPDLKTSDSHLNYAKAYYLNLSEMYTPRSIVFNDYDDLLHWKGAPLRNSGYEVVRFASFERLVNISNWLICNGAKKCSAVRKRNLKQMNFWPRSDDFVPGLDFVDEFSILSNPNNVLLLIGLGTKSNFERNSSSLELKPGGIINAGVYDVPVDRNMVKLARMLQKQATPVLFRGQFSYDVAQRLGYKLGVITGCPSLFISDDIYMGRNLEKRYQMLQERKEDSKLKIAINVIKSTSSLHFAKDILDRYENSIVFAQDLIDVKMLKSMNISITRVRLFYDVLQWRLALSHFDISIGFRIHGSMVALSAGIPTLVIAPDYPVLEMVEEMRIPHTTIFDERLKPGIDIASFVSSTGFDGFHFDENRCEIAKLYKRTFHHFGIKVSSFVSEISRIC
ncbi:Polysaccharide pyruvyl transferase [Gracilaria domingensis]|nr:Polysaccharide pyruvyl transferase [Gracilaria domingensis]